MEFVLVGQPNCGKSTIFNEVIGYKSISSNFPGATVKFTYGKVSLLGDTIQVIDIPGIYSLQTTDEAESVSADYLSRLTSEHVLINVIDASVLSRSLELTIQLLELHVPMVIALNMVDEAERKGIVIDSKKLSDVLGVPVVETNGKKGIGVYELFNEAHYLGRNKIMPNTVRLNESLENTITKISAVLENTGAEKVRLAAIKFLEYDESNKNKFDKLLESDQLEAIHRIRDEFEGTEKNSSDYLIHSSRHVIAFNIFEKAARVGTPPKRDARYILDDILMHPFWGYVLMVAILYVIFSIIFVFGNAVEPLFIAVMSDFSAFLAREFGEYTVLYSIFNGLFSGIAGGIGIVIPYLLPFFLLLSFLEDTGYLARIAYLIDNVMHRIGLHGLSVIPLILGYGCTVPGILATRILKSPRDKFITATLTTLIPCSARMTIIFGLVGFFISMKAAILIYVINIVIVGIAGKFLSNSMPEVSPGLIMEMPKYHLPSLKSLFGKTWYRLKEFVVIAWPLLIVGSIVLEVITHFELTGIINDSVSFFTSGILGLPAAVGVTLLFGILRKELAIILLFSALGTNDISSVMTVPQIFGFTIFATFYIPCLATVAALAKELNWKSAIIISLMTALIAVVLSVVIRYLTLLI